MPPSQEITNCHKCKKEYVADSEDLGTYFCNCTTKKVDMIDMQAWVDLVFLPAQRRMREINDSDSGDAVGSVSECPAILRDDMQD